MVRVSDPFGSKTSGTLPGAWTQNMRCRLTDSTAKTFRSATFGALRDLYVTVFGEPAAGAERQTRMGQIVIVEDRIGVQLGSTEALVQIDGRAVSLCV